MLPSLELAQSFSELRAQALAEGAYEAVMVYHTAEDLTDALSKGLTVQAYAVPLSAAFERNHARAVAQGERAEAEAWGEVRRLCAAFLAKYAA